MIKRVRRACLNCRNSKVACDQQRPCTRCVKLDIGSTCYDLPRKKREKKPKPQSTITKTSTISNISCSNSNNSVCNNITCNSSSSNNSITPILKKQNSNSNSPTTNTTTLSNLLSSNKLSINDNGCLSSSAPSSPLSNLNFKSAISSPKSLSISNICQLPPSNSDLVSSPTSLTPPVQGLKVSNSNNNNIPNNTSNNNIIYQTINDDRNIYVPSNQLGNYSSSITISQNQQNQQYIKNTYPNQTLYSSPGNNSPIPQQQAPIPHTPQQYFYSNKNNTIYQLPSTQTSNSSNLVGTGNETTSFIIAKPCKRSLPTNSTNNIPVKKLNCSQSSTNPSSPQNIDGTTTTTIYYQPTHSQHSHTPPLLPQQHNTGYNTTPTTSQPTYYKSLNTSSNGNVSTTPNTLIGKGGTGFLEQQDYHVVPVTSSNSNTLTFIDASGSWSSYYPTNTTLTEVTPPSPTPSLQQISSSPITSSSIIQATGNSNLVPSQYRSSPVPLSSAYQLYSDTTTIYNTYTDSNGNQNTNPNINNNTQTSGSNAGPYTQYNTVYKYTPQPPPPPSHTTNTQYYTTTQADLLNSSNSTSYYTLGTSNTNNSSNIPSQQTIIFNPSNHTIINPTSVPHHIINNYKII